MIRRKIKSGHYHNASEVVREAPRLLEARGHRERLQKAIAVGFSEMERGEGVPWTAHTMNELIREADEADQ